MSCGQNRLVSKIRLMKHVARNPEWKCTPACFTCKYWEICYYEMLCEEGEIIERYDYEYRVMCENFIYYTHNYQEAIAVMVEKRNIGLEPKLQRRPIKSKFSWADII